MFCNSCGKEIAGGTAFCPNCGAKITAGAAEPAARDDHDGFAIAGFVLGLAGILGLGITIVVPILGLYFSGKGRCSARAGLATAGKVLSIISLAFSVLALVLILAVTCVIGPQITETIMEIKEPMPQTVTPLSVENMQQREILDWYTSLDQIRTNSSDPIPASIVVQVVLGYKAGDKVASTEITAHRVEITDFLRRYFTEHLAEDFLPQKEEILRQDIRDRINDEILSDAMIQDVRFTTKDVITQ